MKLTIGGVDYFNSGTAHVVPGSLSLTRSISEHSTLDFAVVRDYGHRHEIKDRQQVILSEDDDTKIFMGYVVDSNSATRYRFGHGVVSIKTIGNEYLAKKRIVAKTFRNWTFPDILAYLVNNYFGAEGISVGLIPSNVDTREINISFNYCTGYEALDALCSRFKYVWTIDQNKNINITGVGTHKNTKRERLEYDNRIEAGSLSVQCLNEGYRNVQYLPNGFELSSQKVHALKGDGSTRTWALAGKVAEMHLIEVSIANAPYATVAFGEKGTEGYSYYWEKDSETLLQDDTETILTGDDKIRVTYKIRRQVVKKLTHSGAVTVMKSREQGSGLVETTDEVQFVSNLDGINKSNELIELNREDTYFITFSTIFDDYDVGKTVTVYLPEESLENIEFVVKNVTTIFDENNLKSYEVELVRGPGDASWTRFFLGSADQKDNLETAETVVQLVTRVRHWLETDTPNIFGTNLVIPFLLPATFGPGKNKEYTFMNIVTTTAGTKRVEVQFNEWNPVDNVLFSQFFIQAGEDWGDITELQFVWGSGSVDDTSSGVVMDSLAVALQKSEFDAYQVDVFSYKDF